MRARARQDISQGASAPLPDAVDEQVERFVATASRLTFLNLPRGVNLTTAGLGAQQRHAVVSGEKRRRNPFY
eukprot:gene10820-8326_t